MKVILVFVLLIFLQRSTAQTNSAFKDDINNYAKTLKLPTLAVAVAKGDSLIFFHGIGSPSSNTQEAITPDHIFGIASITKLFTSILLQQLEAEGKISLNDPIDKFPNKYFTRDRWTSNTTLAHIISHTSESRPVGTNFIYNGSKYNVVFNVFAAINPPSESESMARPFTKELERRILVPLKMTHTLVRFTEAEHTALKKYVVAPYFYNDSAGKFLPQEVDLPKMECGPGFGMMSSVKDLLKYSWALDNGLLISKQRLNTITRPFYPTSPQGQGWFTTNFEGIEIWWGYGYGNSDAAILLKVPSRELTLVLMSSCDLPSASTRLGYGNPLNSPMVCSFIRNFVLNQPTPFVKGSKSRIYIEETFAKATVTIFSPTINKSDKENSILQIQQLTKSFPADPIWQSTTAFELIATLDDDYLLQFACEISKNITELQNVHPAKLLFAGTVQEKCGNEQQAIRIFKKLAEGDGYSEQGYKFDAMMKLAKHYEKSDPKLSKLYLVNLIKFKDYISVKDNQYKEAKAMYSKFSDN